MIARKQLSSSKQEMARVNIDILGISELKWTGMGEFNTNGHYIHYCGQESLRGNGVALIVNKGGKNIKREETVFSIKWCWENRTPHVKERIRTL